MLGLAIYCGFMALLIGVFYHKHWYGLDERSLSAQPLFWAGIGVPVVTFFFFGAFAWWGRGVDLSAAGFGEFVNISTLPLALLSLAIPFGTIIANAHRATQTSAQIVAGEKKNAIDGYYAHEKNFVERCKVLELGETDIFGQKGQPQKIHIPLAHQLYRKVYPGASSQRDADYQPNTMTECIIREKVKGVSEALWRHVDAMERGEPSLLGDEAELVFVVLLMTYEVFDCIGIANISRNYYYMKSSRKGVQVNLGSEEAFKEALRLLLSITSATIDIISTKPLDNVHGIRRYAYSTHPYFVSFQDASYACEIVAPTWRETVNLFSLGGDAQSARPSPSTEGSSA